MCFGLLLVHPSPRPSNRPSWNLVWWNVLPSAMRSNYCFGHFDRYAMHSWTLLTLWYITGMPLLRSGETRIPVTAISVSNPGKGIISMVRSGPKKKIGPFRKIGKPHVYRGCGSDAIPSTCWLTVLCPVYGYSKWNTVLEVSLYLILVSRPVYTSLTLGSPSDVTSTCNHFNNAALHV